MTAPYYGIPPRGFTIPIGDGFTIYYYAIMIVCGIILATVVVGLLFKRRNIPVEWVLDLLLCVLPVGIVCARLFYCITGGVPFPYWFSLDEEHGIRAGGLSIIGGVMGGVLGVVLFCVIHKINFLRVADCVAPGVILAQGIGRWGNFFNQEVYGGLVENTSLQWFPFAVYIENTNSWHYAFFFYESVLNIIAFALLFTLLWKFRKKPGGLALAGYLFGYGVVRAIMEPLRAPQYILGDSVQVSWVMAIVMAVAGVMLALCLLIWNYKKYGRLFGAPDEAEAYADLPVYYTKEARLAMEEAERKRRAARKAKAGGHPARGAGRSPEETHFDPSAPEQDAAEEGGHPARGAGRSLEETPFEPSAPEQDAAEAGKPSAPEQDAAEAGGRAANLSDKEGGRAATPAPAEGKGEQTEEGK